MFKILPLGLLLVTGAVQADPTINYEAPYGHDYDTMSVEMQVDSMSKQKGYFWANNYIFYNGNHQGYIGIQPRAKGQSNVAIFSAFGEGAKSTSANCRSGADGGKGVSCSVAYEFKTGRKYSLKIENTKAGDPAYNHWLGTITDVATGEQVTIGEYMTPISWGMLWRKSSFFTEWFPFNAGPSVAAKRNCAPYAKLTTYNPVFMAKGKSVNTKITGSRITGGQDKCAVAHGSPNARLTLGTDHHIVENGIFSQ